MLYETRSNYHPLPTTNPKTKMREMFCQQTVCDRSIFNCSGFLLRIVFVYFLERRGGIECWERGYRHFHQRRFARAWYRLRPSRHAWRAQDGRGRCRSLGARACVLPTIHLGSAVPPASPMAQLSPVRFFFLRACPSLSVLYRSC